MAINEGLRTFTANGALAIGERVVITAGSTTTPPQVAQAPVGGTSAHVGYVEKDAVSGDPVTIRPTTQSGTKQAIASAAIAVGAVIYGSALGRVSTTASGTAIGVTLTASTAAGDIIEIIEY